MNRFKSITPLQPATNVQGRAVLHPKYDGPLFRGGGDSSYACPHCGRVLAESVAETSIFDIVVECGACHELCEFDRLPQGAVATGYVFLPARPYQFGVTVDLATPTLIIGDGAITGGGTPLWN